MNLSSLGRASAIGVAISLLAGCGGSSRTQAAIPFSSVTTQQIRRHSKSWVSREAKSEALLYAVGECSGTCVFSYPKGKLVGTISGYQGIGNGGACSDDSGHVYISNNNEVVEFEHAGTSPIATFSLPAGDAIGCAVDSNTGNLAVVFSATAIAVFNGGSSSPSIYNSLLEDSYCGYDNAGNLFVSGFSGSQYGLSELRRGANAFTSISIPQTVGEPGQVQWDGNYITYESASAAQPTISRLSISGSAATIVSQTILLGVKRRLAQSWIYKGSVIAPYSTRGAHPGNIGFWRYPKGGHAYKKITKVDGYKKRTLSFSGATISVAK